MLKERLQSISKNAIALNPDFVHSAKEKKAAWIGKKPATDAAIRTAEKRLSVKLPQDVVDFYKITNGTSEILNQTFSGFMGIRDINWLKNLLPDTLENYAEMGEEYVKDLSNCIVIAGVNHVHQVLIIPPLDVHQNWRYWEFAHYIPGENSFNGMDSYLERLDDFLCDQIKNKPQ